jgi:hypothetical protein
MVLNKKNRTRERERERKRDRERVTIFSLEGRHVFYKLF